MVVIGDTGSTTIHCNALHTKPATDVVWSVGQVPTGITTVVTPPGDPSATVGSPTDAVAITFTGAAGTEVPQRSLSDDDASDGFQIDLAFVDNDGSHDAEYPSLAQPNTIQQLEQVVAEKLGVGDGFGLSLGDIGGTDVVILDLNIGRCNADALCPGAANMPALTTSLNADVDGLGGLVSASSDGDITVGYNAAARLQLAFALSGGTPQVWVMPDTGMLLQGQFDATDLNFTAAFGPIEVAAGSAVVDDGGTPDDDTDDSGGLGTVQLGVELTVGGPSAIPAGGVDLNTFLGGLGTYLAPDFAPLNSVRDPTAARSRTPRTPATRRSSPARGVPPSRSASTASVGPGTSG